MEYRKHCSLRGGQLIIYSEKQKDSQREKRNREKNNIYQYPNIKNWAGWHKNTILT